MTTPTPPHTELLRRVSGGERRAADELLELVYEDFRSMAAAYLRHESNDVTLQPTALVHEAFLRLIDQKRVQWQGRTHFLAIGAKAMRRILVDNARRRNRKKRGGSATRISFEEQLFLSPDHDHDLIAVDQLLAELQEIDPRQSQIVELRFFGGMTSSEVAQYLGISKSTVDREWRVVRAWLRQQLNEDDKA
ncbi:RNA polymerase sigma factor [Stieleria neptunia]|uniref:RNA polymerase sigma factor n=1 Tax=Stieleria neptunia TaxID=2527979 RepID=A0A518HHL1_9BACT|nr:ECF-type sigma factor [Stieleria neptunia]QDV40324.1 RNA polymerase sigma factor [Stieleria neptunia]